MLTEEEVRAEYDEILDKLGHTVNLSPIWKIILESQMRILEIVLEIKP